MTQQQGKHRVICITQARLGSSRLPKKVLKQIDSMALIEYHFTRIANSQTIEQHILSTSDADLDTPLADFAKQRKWLVYRGSEDNVLSRFYHTATQQNAQAQDIIIRLTGDCPLICPQMLDEVVKQHLKYNHMGYSHLALDTFPRGFDVEVFPMSLLSAAYKSASCPAAREHVTLDMYSKPDEVKIHAVKLGQAQWGTYRLCVDEPDDFNMIKALLAGLKKSGLDWQTLNAKQICEFLDEHPEIACLNQEVQQKTTH